MTQCFALHVYFIFCLFDIAACYSKNISEIFCFVFFLHCNALLKIRVVSRLNVIKQKIRNHFSQMNTAPKSSRETLFWDTRTTEDFYFGTCFQWREWSDFQKQELSSTSTDVDNLQFAAFYLIILFYLIITKITIYFIFEHSR